MIERNEELFCLKLGFAQAVEVGREYPKPQLDCGGSTVVWNYCKP